MVARLCTGQYVVTARLNSENLFTSVRILVGAGHVPIQSNFIESDSSRVIYQRRILFWIKNMNRHRTFPV